MNLLPAWLRRWVRSKSQPVGLAKPTLQSSTEEPISVESAASLLQSIKAKGWWQGSVISADALSSHLAEHREVSWWVIATQTCNLYNPCFQKVPVFELLAAREITRCEPQNSKGDNPRLLHLEAQSADKNMALELDIQKRCWLPRELLAELQAPRFHVTDAKPDTDPNWRQKLWLDKFTGWLARSYTRPALPDSFNEALKASRIEEVFQKKLIKHEDALYGIYLSIDTDTEDGWNGVLGEMPSPYLLEILLVSYENVDPEPLKTELVDHIFRNKIQAPNDGTQKITRAELAKQHHIRIVESAINAKTEKEVTLLELKQLIRYSFVDYLSHSSAVVEN